MSGPAAPRQSPHGAPEPRGGTPQALELPRAPRLPEPDFFLWATGIEDTFITDPWPVTGRTLEEYELTHHYDCWPDDVARLASLGLRAVRYGIPWYRVQPAPGRWDWSFPDQVLPALREQGLEVILDLVHYGVPAWLEGAFLNPDYPRYVAEYAAKVAERYRGLLRWFTPLNEPRITAWYAGRVGLWPPYASGWSGFARVALNLAEGICRASHALRQALPEAALVHVDATDQYVSDDPTLAAEAELRQQLGFLALDLVSGRVDDRHELWQWLARRGLTVERAEWFRKNAVPLDVVGVNMYPMFSLKRLVRTPAGVRQRTPPAPPEVLENLLRWYWERYRRPVMVTETAGRGNVRRRAAWLTASVDAVRRLRAEGIPVIGYTWWPLYGLVSWEYRTGFRPAAAYVKQMGLWDLQPDEAGRLIRRVETPLVEQYRNVAAGGLAAVGLWNPLAGVPPSEQR